MEGKNSNKCYANRIPIIGFLFAFFFTSFLLTNPVYGNPYSALPRSLKVVSTPPDSGKIREIKQEFVKAGSRLKAKFSEMGKEMKQAAESPKMDSLKQKAKSSWKKVVTKSKTAVSRK